MSRFKRSLYLATGLTGLYAGDQLLYDQTFSRNFRTLWNGALITADYKLFYNEENAEKINELQSRVAERIFNVCTGNGGLYIKFGQQIASVNHILPPEWIEKFKVLFDDAPSVSYDQVKRLFKQEFGKEPLEIFQTFESEPIASASIAQVHKATLKDGTRVAVKVQKPYIETQMNWDLRTHAFVTKVFERLFDMKLSWSIDYVHGHLRKEVDFINEGQNAEKAYQHILDSHLRDSCYVPKVYWDCSSKKVLTMEWIDGTRFDKESLINAGFNITKVMKTIVELFSVQIFSKGFVHADPHLGNILVRKHKGREQIVLIDHGLYSSCRPEFTKDYCLFWKSIFTRDNATLEAICLGWGISDVQMFASATLQRPWDSNTVASVKESVTMKQVYEMQMQVKERAQKFLSDTDKLPKELLFIGRNINLIRSNNKALGSPVNRINIMVDTAVKSLGDKQWVKYDYFYFKFNMLLSNTLFYLNQLLQKSAEFIGLKTRGFEDRLDETMRLAIKAKYGIAIDQSAFDA